jgi:hypothetical protein
MVDLDFIYRITSAQVKIAWCTGVLSMHISHPNGNFNKMSQKSRDIEFKRIYRFYHYNKRTQSIKPEYIKMLVQDMVEAIKRPIRPAKRRFFDRMGWAQYENPEKFMTGIDSPSGINQLNLAYEICDNFLKKQHDTEIKFVF